MPILPRQFAHENTDIVARRVSTLYYCLKPERGNRGTNTEDAHPLIPAAGCGIFQMTGLTRTAITVGFHDVHALSFFRFSEYQRVIPASRRVAVLIKRSAQPQR